MRLLGGPSAGESCTVGVMATEAAVDSWVGVWIIWVGAVLSLLLERVLLHTASSVDWVGDSWIVWVGAMIRLLLVWVLLLTGSSVDCVRVVFVVACVLEQFSCVGWPIVRLRRRPVSACL